MGIVRASHYSCNNAQVRRDEIREKGAAHKALLHKTRFIWLKNPWNLTETQHRRLAELEHLNLKINRAYLLKELFAYFWSYEGKAEEPGDGFERGLCVSNSQFSRGIQD